jgi:2-polyprenyl-6-methoxyphenol hydroxylase-like FAD-dependent oxidoreductase
MARAKDEHGVTLGAAVVACAEPPAHATRRLAPHVTLTDVGDYLRWTLSLRGADTAVTPHRFWGSTGLLLQAIAENLVAAWHPDLRAIVDNADPSSTYPFGIFAARPVRRWDQPGVTLLGDAIHTMTPGRGEGANTALRDAALLAALLTDAATGKGSMTAAIAAYETEMLRYGFEAVENSRTPYFSAALKIRP